MSDNFKHLGHGIGPAPTSQEIGLNWQPPNETKQQLMEEQLEQDKAGGADSDGSGQQEGAAAAKGHPSS